MEPFDLTLHQVTYEEGSDSPDELDSFGTVVNYDSHFSQVDTVPTTCSTPLTFTAATENRGIIWLNSTISDTDVMGCFNYNLTSLM